MPDAEVWFPDDREPKGGDGMAAVESLRFPYLARTPAFPACRAVQSVACRLFPYRRCQIGVPEFLRWEVAVVPVRLLRRLPYDRLSS